MPSQVPVARGEARERILDSAEELFAELGVEGVSLRAINSAAGVSPGVLHYHFGSREVLVHELINRHLKQLMEQRILLLEPLTRQLKPRVRDIVLTQVEPLAQLALQGNGAAKEEAILPGPRYLRFIARLSADRSTMLDEVSQRYQEIRDLCPLLLHRALPGVDPAVLDLRLAMANHAMLQILSDLTRQVRPRLANTATQVDNKLLTAMLVDFMSAGIIGHSEEQSQ